MIRIYTFFTYLGINRVFKTHKSILKYPDKLYVGLPGSTGQTMVGDIDYFKSTNKIKLVEYQRVQVVEVTYPAQITVPKNQTIEG